MMRRPDEAMAQIERALALDPFNPLFQVMYAADLIFVRRYDDAIAAARNVPGNPAAMDGDLVGKLRPGDAEGGF